jgi:hypothetical protein
MSDDDPNTWDDVADEATYADVAGDEVGTLAAGGDATAAGMTTVAATDQLKMGYDEINKSRDYIAQFAARNRDNLLDLWTGTSSPAHKAGRIWIHPAG